MLGPDLILRDEGPMLGLIASPNAQAKAGHALVEFDMLGLAGLDLEAVNFGLSKLHGLPPFGKTMGRLKPSSQVFPCPRVVLNNRGYIGQTSLFARVWRHLSSHVHWILLII